MTYRIRKLFSFGVIGAAALLVMSSAVFAQTGGIPSETPVPIGPKDMRFQERYRFGYQDRVEIEVYRHEELSIKADIGEDGTISMPRIKGPIVAVCKTERELANEITAKLSKELRDPFVTVRASEQKSQSFAVIGAVGKPGAFFLSRRIKLLELLAMAGGPSKEAGARILVARTGSFSVCQNDLSGIEKMADTSDPSQTLITFDRDTVLKGKDNIWMQPGDIVSVLEAEVVYVVGNVVRPSAVPMKKQITLSEAIAAAEGVKPSTKKDKIRILRKKPDGLEREVIMVDLGAIEKMQQGDPVLQADDIVAVNEDGVKTTMNAIVRALIGGASTLPYVLRF